MGLESIWQHRLAIFEQLKFGFKPEEIADFFAITKEQVIYLSMEFSEKYGVSVSKELSDYLH